MSRSLSRPARPTRALASFAALLTAAGTAAALWLGGGTATATSTGNGPAPTGPEPSAVTPYQQHGALEICGTRLCGEDGTPVQLRGMSSHGTQWFEHCLTEASLDALAHDWGASVLRLSTYVQEDGYASDPQYFTDLASRVIDQATARGLYVIVDWHMLTPGDPNANTDLAKRFFTDITDRHGDQDNLLYEIANEPNGVSWQSIKSYAEELIPVVRAGSPDAVVLVGTRGWSSLGVSEGSDEREIIANPVDAENIAYTFHFYAASHRDNYLAALDRASDQLPVFVTEWGTQDYTGDGANDFANAQRYLDLMAAKGIGWTNWNFSDDWRSGAVFREGSCAAGQFSGTAPLKEAGIWVRDRV